jgi:hypothetical protein
MLPEFGGKSNRKENRVDLDYLWNMKRRSKEKGFTSLILNIFKASKSKT